MSDNPKKSYFEKKSRECPVCERENYHEVILSGRGRLNAGVLTDELRRLYVPTEKYGSINPLVYPIVVCPDCLFATFAEDFVIKDKRLVEQAKSMTNQRVQMVLKMFGPLDFNQERNEKLGAASYILAVSSYSFVHKDKSPTLQKAVSSLRAAWLLEDLFNSAETDQEKKKYSHIQELMYRKAHVFYKEMLDKSQTGAEPLNPAKLGPDVNKNWGYDGFLYMNGILQMKLGFFEKDMEKRGHTYAEAKRILSKLFGSGKKSKSKPSEILDLARDAYDQLGEYVKEIEGELGIKIG